MGGAAVTPFRCLKRRMPHGETARSALPCRRGALLGEPLMRVTLNIDEFNRISLLPPSPAPHTVKWEREWAGRSQRRSMFPPSVHAFNPQEPLSSRNFRRSGQSSPRLSLPQGGCRRKGLWRRLDRLRLNWRTGERAQLRSILRLLKYNQRKS